VTTYIARQDALDPQLSPYDWYRGLIVAGAQQNGLSESYIDDLKAISCIPDPVEKRKTRIEALDLLKRSGFGLFAPTPEGVRLAGEKTVADWKVLKVKLAKRGASALWHEACHDFFIARLKTRYLDPIRLLQKSNSRQGEGFAIVSLHCSLIEFLASTLVGKSYRFRGKCGANEYSKSGNLFVELMSICKKPSFVNSIVCAKNRVPVPVAE
jgi:hypothetical protein